jgi:RNA polymerase sigma-70 factor (ECF subfamily)
VNARSNRTGSVVRALPFEGDDAELVKGMLAGHASAAAAYYDRHAEIVHGLAFRILGPDPELEDVVHDVFVRALESLPTLRDPYALRSWTLGITVFTVRIRIQKRARQKWLRFFPPDEVPEMQTLPETELGEALGDVFALLKALPADERIALVLHRVEGLPLEEAARVAGMSLSTFRRRLARAEAKFFTRAERTPALAEWLRGQGR